MMSSRFSFCLPALAAMLAACPCRRRAAGPGSRARRQDRLPALSQCPSGGRAHPAFAEARPVREWRAHGARRDGYRLHGRGVAARLIPDSQACGHPARAAHLFQFRPYHEGRVGEGARGHFGHNGAEIFTRPVPVLAVTQVACTKTARRCRPRDNPTGIAMIGVGFARKGEIASFGLPDNNPFLSLPDMGSGDTPGAMRRGYVVTRRGVQIGLSAENAEGMDFIKLETARDQPGWAPVPACCRWAGARPPPAARLSWIRASPPCT